MNRVLKIGLIVAPIVCLGYYFSSEYLDYLKFKDKYLNESIVLSLETFSRDALSDVNDEKHLGDEILSKFYSSYSELDTTLIKTEIRGTDTINIYCSFPKSNKILEDEILAKDFGYSDFVLKRNVRITLLNKLIVFNGQTDHVQEAFQKELEGFLQFSDSLDKSNEVPHANSQLKAK